MLEVAPGVVKKLDETFKAMERIAAAALRREGFPPAKQRHERSLALRYKGQSFELEIKRTSRNIAAEFHRVHQERYGYMQTANVVEIVSARVRSSGIVEKIAEQKATKSAGKTFASPSKIVSAYLDGKKQKTLVFNRAELSSGARLRTPCLVTEYSSTTLIPPGMRVEVDDYGNLIIQVT